MTNNELNELNNAETARSLRPAQAAPVRRENSVAAPGHAEATGAEASLTGKPSALFGISPFAGDDAE